MKLNSRLLGTACAALGSMAYGLNPLFAKHLFACGLDVPSVLLCRFSLGAILTLILVLLYRSPLLLPWKTMLCAVVNGIMMSLSATFLFKAYLVMDVGLASTLLFVYPIMTAIIMCFLFHEKISWNTIAAILLSLLGVFSLNGTSQGGGGIPLDGLILILLSSLTYAIYIVMVRVSPLKDAPSDTLTFWALVFGIPTFFIQVKGGTALILPPDLAGFGLVLGLAFFTTFISLWLSAIGIQKVGATTTAILGALEPLTAIVIGVMVFHEALTMNLCLGMALIGLAVLLVILKPNAPKTE